MQKLIILDDETGTAHIVNCPIGFDVDDDEYEGFITDLEKKLDINNFHSTTWMIVLEINDTTV